MGQNAPDSKEAQSSTSDEPKVPFPADEAVGSYCNYVTVVNSPEEFILDFFQRNGQGTYPIKRILMSPGHMQRFITALSDNLARWQERAKDDQAKS